MGRGRSLFLAAAWSAGCWLLWRMPRPQAPAEGYGSPAGARPGPDAAPPLTVSVIIPARNEEGALPHLLRSLATQTRPPDEVLVVDDHSTDGTARVAAAAGAAGAAGAGAAAAVGAAAAGAGAGAAGAGAGAAGAAAAGAGAGAAGAAAAGAAGAAEAGTGTAAGAAGAKAGVRVIAGAALPPGWGGKCWACHQGAAEATGDRLLFLDADVTLAPDALHHLLGEHRRRGGLLSVQPYHRTERTYERLSAVANVVALMGSGAFTAPPRPRVTVAYGPCLLIGRADYQALGGHAHPDVRDRMPEDIALAHRAVALGRPVTAMAGRDRVAFRMYPGGPRQLADGWTKMLAAGARSTPWPVMALVAAWVTGALMGAADGWRAVRLRQPARAVGYAAWAAQLGWMLRRTGRFGAATAVAYPVPLLAFVALFARSAYAGVLRRPVAWKGRPVRAAPVRPRRDRRAARGGARRGPG